MASESNSKLLPQKLGMYCVLSSTPRSVTIDEDRIPNKISAERASLVLEQQTATSAPPIDPDHNNQQTQPAEPLAKDTLEATVHDKYTVDHILKKASSGRDLKYLVRWYGYMAAEDTLKPLHHIPQHFMKRYWCRVRT